MTEYDAGYKVGYDAGQSSRDVEIERLRGLLKHADDVTIWEHTVARAGFQEEVEAALGVGQQTTATEKET